MKTDRFLSDELQNIHSKLKKHLIDKNDDTPLFIFNEINLSELIKHISCEKIFFFKSKYDNFTFLGLGHSQTIKAQDLSEYINRNPSHFLVAAFLFEEDPNASEFILPEWIFVSKNEKTELSIHKSIEYKNFSSPNLFFNLKFDLNLYDLTIPPWQSYEEFPEHDQWEKMINKCDMLFDGHELEKIALSRKKIFDYDEPLEPTVFFNAVMSQNNNANSSYAIFYQMTFDKAFISLTPEKLFSLADNNFESISLAASSPRGVTPEEDLAFEKLLNSSDKLSREHNVVTAEILRKIKPLASSVIVSELQTMKLPYIQHRSVPIKAVLLSNIMPLELVSLLHPTPAVGGLPWDSAKMRILELEPYARKSYAAPIGVISKHFSELAVGIRSALIEGSRISIFGGAGIVKGSAAEEEWIETGIKMNPFLKVVNHE
ncbi:MAG: isochorismate synthase [Bacteriovorax sp.]|nr:isochorismate synthase [Bacteriovorax sp.]